MYASDYKTATLVHRNQPNHNIIFVLPEMDMVACLKFLLTQMKLEKEEVATVKAEKKAVKEIKKANKTKKKAKDKDVKKKQ
jgi:hypothetical protein